MLVIGIDPSAKKIAVVAYETVTGTYKVASGSLYPKGATKQTTASLHNAAIFMRDFLYAVDHMTVEGQRYAYVEKPLVGRGGADATIKQAYVGGIIRACLAEAGYTVYDVHPSTWRSRLAIKAKTTVAIKAATKTLLNARWPKIVPEVAHDGDLTDAAAICLYGRDQSATAARLAASANAGGDVQGGGPDVVLRRPRVRRVVRRS